MLSGDYKMTIMLLVLYGVTQLVRQVIQPKLVGDGLGMQPLVALCCFLLDIKWEVYWYDFCSAGWNDCN